MKLLFAFIFILCILMAGRCSFCKGNFGGDKGLRAHWNKCPVRKEHLRNSAAHAVAAETNRIESESAAANAHANFIDEVNCFRAITRRNSSYIGHRLRLTFPVNRAPCRPAQVVVLLAARGFPLDTAIIYLSLQTRFYKLG